MIAVTVCQRSPGHHVDGGSLVDIFVSLRGDEMAALSSAGFIPLDCLPTITPQRSSGSASGRQSEASGNYRSEKGRVIVLTFDGFEGCRVGFHEDPSIPRGCLEQVGYQIVNIAYDNRILFWSS